MNRRILPGMLVAALLWIPCACADDVTQPPEQSNNGANNGATNNGASNNGDNGPNPGDPNYPDEPWPQWALEDFQPKSERFQETYGLEVVEDEPTVTLVVFLAGWCGYCRAQAKALEEILIELREEGTSARFYAVNAISADTEDYKNALVYELDDDGNIQYNEADEPLYRCTFPQFQDVESQNVWTLMNGSKDDIYIYKPDGTLYIWLPAGGPISTNLATATARENLKSFLRDAGNEDDQ